MSREGALWIGGVSKKDDQFKAEQILSLCQKQGTPMSEIEISFYERSQK